MSGEWMFSRGTLKAHYVTDGKALCGSGNHFEKACIKVEEDFWKCKKCLAKLGDGTK